MEEITDKKLIDLGFNLEYSEKEEITGSHRWTVKTWVFEKPYNYYLHGKAYIKVVRSSGKFPQFEGYYWIGIRHFKDIQGTILLSKTKDYNALVNIIKALTQSTNYSKKI